MSSMPDLPPVGLLPAEPLPVGAPAPARHLRLAPAPDAQAGWADGPAEAEFEDFVRRYEGRLRGLALRRLGDRGEAEEVAQETLLRAYQHRASFRNEDELMAWSTVVAGRLVIDRTRVRGRSVAVGEVPEGTRAGRDTADIVVARHEARAALDALEAMPARQAAILWAREVEGLSYDDIAGRFGMSEPTVRSLLHRGRRALRKEYASRGGTLPVAGLIVLSPWLRGLNVLKQLRSGAKSQAVAVGAVTMLGAIVLGVGGGALHTPDASAGQPRLAGPSTMSVADTAHGVAAVTKAELATAAATRRSSVAAAPDAQTFANLPGACAAQAACLNRDHAAPDDVFWIGPALPDNPTGIRRVGISSDGPVHCRALPDTPVTECGPPDDDSSPPIAQIDSGDPR